MGMMIRRNRAKKAAEKAALKPVVKPVVKPVEKVEEKKPSKSEIARMPVAELRKLAGDNGLESPEEMTGSELKEWLNENI